MLNNEALPRENERQKPSCEDASRPIDDLISDLFLRTRLGKTPEKDRPAALPVNCVTSAGGPESNGRMEEEQVQRLGNEFMGRLIQEYEQAVQRGLPATRAMASLLEWAASECQHL